MITPKAQKALERKTKIEVNRLFRRFGLLGILVNINETTKILNVDVNIPSMITVNVGLPNGEKIEFHDEPELALDLLDVVRILGEDSSLKERL